MSLLGKVFKTAFDTVSLPIDIVKDMATLGGVITENDEPYTIQKLKKLTDDLDEVRNKIDKL